MWCNIIKEENKMVIERDNTSKESIWQRIGKRNLIVAATVLLIGAAVFANFLLFSDNDGGFGGYDQSGGMATGGDAGTGDTTDVGDTYFATMQVSRKRARDEALEILQSIADNTDSDEASKTQALSDINRLALEMAAESNIETLVMAKGFADCIAVINGDMATVVVATDGDELLATEISQINEIVYEQADILPVNIKITKR